MEVLFKIFLIGPLLSQAAVFGPRQARLSLAEPLTNYMYMNTENQHGAYAFRYDISDAVSGNSQFRAEERHPNGTVTGSYGYVDPFGIPRLFRYIADNMGYRLLRDKPRNIYLQTDGASSRRPGNSYTTESSITWTRPQRRSNKKKVNTSNNQYYNEIVNRPFRENRMIDFTFNQLRDRN